MLTVRILVIALLAAVASMGGAYAASSIRVLVNDQPITSYDIAQRIKLMRLANEKGGEKQAIEQLIDETIELSEAKKRGFLASNARVDAAYASIAGNMKLSPAALTKALAGQGVDDETLKKRLKAQISWSEFMKARARYEIAVKPSDITAQLLAKGSPDAISTTEYTLQQIVFVVPKGSSPAYVAQRRREAEGYRLRFAGCEGSVAQAKALKGVVVRPFGRHLANELTGREGKAVTETPVGKTTPPVQIDQGVVLIAVCSTRDIKSNAAARAEIEQKLTFEQGKDLGKDVLKKLREKAVIEYR